MSQISANPGGFLILTTFYVPKLNYPAADDDSDDVSHNPEVRKIQLLHSIIVLVIEFSEAFLYFGRTNMGALKNIQ